jgi:hypothetical protein
MQDRMIAQAQAKIDLCDNVFRQFEATTQGKRTMALLLGMTS